LRGNTERKTSFILVDIISQWKKNSLLFSLAYKLHLVENNSHFRKNRIKLMKTQNRTNLVLLIVLALLLTIACSPDEETETQNTNKDDVASTSNNDDTTVTDDEADTSEDEDSDEPEADNGPTTVKFEKGKTSRKYKNSVKSGESKIYYLGASAGQTMNIKINSSQENAGFIVYDPAGNEISGGEETLESRDFSQELDDSGKYKIVVKSGRNTSYDINFEVSAKSKDLTAREAEGGANKTVKFGKGNSSASYKNSVIRGDRDTYILGARAGQFMTVSITSLEDNASFEVVAPNGENLVDDDTNWTGELPANGNYKIIVGSGRGNATYTVKFAVAQSKIRD
jgi:hypothetical protein